MKFSSGDDDNFHCCDGDNSDVGKVYDDSFDCIDDDNVDVGYDDNVEIGNDGNFYTGDVCD